MLYLYIAAGGAFGAVCRFALSQWIKGWAGGAFPYATLAVNILGALLMGILLGWLMLLMPKGRELYLLLGVGALGGFTTFSTFTYESYMLFERGEWLMGSFYISASVIGSLIAFLLGMWLFKVFA